jgi:DNA-binding transcriptional regulator YhcF (GntR family)
MSYRLMVAVLYHSQGSAVERLILVALAERANTKTGRCWPSVQELCARTRYHRTTVLRALRQLEKRGELAITVRRRRGNLYRITLPEMAQPYVAERDLRRRISKSRSATRMVAESDSSGRGERLQPVREPVKEPVRGADAPAARQRFAAAKHRRGRSLRSSGPTSAAIGPSDRTDPPDPQVTSLIAGFRQLHLMAIGQPYPPAWGRDGACLKRALRTWDAAAIERAMRHYFDDRDARLQFGADVPAFVRRIPTLLARGTADTVRGFVG